MPVFFSQVCFVNIIRIPFLVGRMAHSVVIVIDKKPFSFKFKAIDTRDQMLSTAFSHQ